MRILMMICGVLLLLPGACSLVFIVLSIGESSNGPLPLLWLICFGISAGGIVLIAKASRK